MYPIIGSAVEARIRFAEVRFEDFEKDPLGETERIYRALDLSGFERARPRFETYLTSVRGYRKNRYRFDPGVIRLVETHWAPFIRQWGYGSPESIGDQLPPKCDILLARPACTP